MKNISAICFCIVLSSCSYQRVSFSTYIYSSEKGEKKIYYYISIPRNYTLLVHTAGGGEPGKEQLYRYPDSSLITISNECSANDKNIENAGLSKCLQERNWKGASALDTLVLQGRDDRGRYWKQVYIGPISIGYSNVDSSQMVVYEKVIKSLR